MQWIVIYNDNTNIGIKHGFSYINVRQVLKGMLKTEDEAGGFPHLLRDLAEVIASNNYVA